MSTRFSPCALLLFLALAIGCAPAESPKPTGSTPTTGTGEKPREDGDTEKASTTENGTTESGNSAEATAAGGNKVITVDGSSTLGPVSEAVAEEFMTAKKGVKVTVGVSGTGGGFKKFLRGELDIADASRPILEKEMASAKEAGIEYIEIPVCFDALT